jgi:hypothetical protein
MPVPPPAAGRSRETSPPKRVQNMRSPDAARKLTARLPWEGSFREKAIWLAPTGRLDGVAPPPPLLDPHLVARAVEVARIAVDPAPDSRRTAPARPVVCRQRPRVLLTRRRIPDLQERAAHRGIVRAETGHVPWVGNRRRWSRTVEPAQKPHRTRTARSYTSQWATF